MARLEGHVGADLRTVDVGSSLPTVGLLVSQERIDRYADLSGDYNPLHVDPDFGSRTPFGSTIAHGPLAGTLFFDVIGDWLGVSWPDIADFELLFTAPVRAGDQVTASGTVRERTKQDGQDVLIVDLQCINQRGDVAIRGTAQILLRDGSV